KGMDAPVDGLQPFGFAHLGRKVHARAVGTLVFFREDLAQPKWALLASGRAHGVHLGLGCSSCFFSVSMKFPIGWRCFCTTVCAAFTSNAPWQSSLILNS